MFVHHSSWSTLEKARQALAIAEGTGAELVLLSYPPNFYPESEQDIYDYTKAICDATDLAVMLFPMYLWGFSPRIHPSDIPVRLVRRLIDDCPNIVAIKAEGGFPYIMGVVECHRHFGDEVVISCPIEYDMIPLAQTIPIQLSATSDHEYYGPMIPGIHRHPRPGSRQRDGGALADPSGPQGEGGGGRAAARRGLHQPAGMEVAGLAAGIQRRTAASADAAHPRCSDERRSARDCSTWAIADGGIRTATFFIGRNPG